jgi:PilZ domain
MTKPQRKRGSGALNTLNQCLGTDEWQEALSAAKTQRAAGKPDTDRRDPDSPRHHAVRRCLLRVDRGESAPGIYIVRSRDISDGGLRLVHGGPVKPGSVCCVIIETAKGQSIAAGGVVTWCNPIDDTTHPAFELGVRFYEPIDSSGFAEQTQPNEDAA